MKKAKQAPWFVWLTRPFVPYNSWKGHRLCQPFGGPIPASDWERLAPPSLHLEPGGGPLKVSPWTAERPESCRHTDIVHVGKWGNGPEPIQEIWRCQACGAVGIERYDSETAKTIGRRRWYLPGEPMKGLD